MQSRNDKICEAVRVSEIIFFSEQNNLRHLIGVRLPRLLCSLAMTLVVNSEQCHHEEAEGRRGDLDLGNCLVNKIISDTLLGFKCLVES